MESQKYNKLVNKTKKKEIQRYREQTSEGEGGAEGKMVIMGLYEIMCVKFLKILKHYRI